MNFFHTANYRRGNKSDAKQLYGISNNSNGLNYVCVYIYLFKKNFI